MVEILLFGIGYGMALGTTLVAVLHFTEFEGNDSSRRSRGALLNM